MGYSRVSISRVGRFCVLAATLGALAACGSNDKILPGQRYAIGATADVSYVNTVASIRLPNAVSNAEWVNVNGSAKHAFGHATLGQSPSLRWTADIGQGETRKARLTAGPVAANGLVYVLDGASRISAISSDGSTVWSIDVSLAGEKGIEGTGGGLSYNKGTLYAGTGFGELLAIDAASGKIKWRRAFEAGIRSAPTSDGRNVYVVTRADIAYGIGAKDGSLEWLVRGATSSTGGVEGGASPAISGSQIILPFSSGELIAVRTSNGAPKWRVALDSARAATSLAHIGDISGDPVIDGSNVYASNLAGQTVKINLATGAEKWSLAEGASDAVWPVGGSVFLMSDQAQLMRVNSANGKVIWAQQLPQFEKPEKREDLIRHYGPVLAGGLMWVAGRDGVLRGFAPESGEMISRVSIPNGAAAAPIVVAGVMYVLSLDGELHAFQ